MVWSIDTCQNEVSADQYLVPISLKSGYAISNLIMKIILITRNNCGEKLNENRTTAF